MFLVVGVCQSLCSRAGPHCTTPDWTGIPPDMEPDWTGTPPSSSHAPYQMDGAHLTGMLHVLLLPVNKVWDEVIFSEACVTNSVHGGGGGISACIAGGIITCLAGLWGVVSQHALQVSRPTPKGKLRVWLEGGSPGPPPGGS